MTRLDPARLIEELTADLEPCDAVALAAELTRMIELGILELDDQETGEPRVRIAAERDLAANGGATRSNQAG
jgi:hypothetical protein